MQLTPEQRIRDVMNATRVGDAFGQRFLEPGADDLLAHRRLPGAPWSYTDDTVLTYALRAHLSRYGRVRPELLGGEFADAWERDPNRGYGASVARLFRLVSQGASASELASQQFDGMGSAGNGSAMRVAVVGAWHEDLPSVKRDAEAQSRVTHTHPEAVNASIAIAVAAHHLSDNANAPSGVLEATIASVPDGTIASRLRKIARLGPSVDARTITSAVGRSSSLLARDTVPFCLWVVASRGEDFEEALWTCAEVGGDTDTTAAIVAGLVVLTTGAGGIPKTWLDATEPAPDY